MKTDTETETPFSGKQRTFRRCRIQSLKKVLQVNCLQSTEYQENALVVPWSGQTDGLGRR